ncbi:LamG domain-containing protein [Mucilaginibacter sp.]|uniref:LamG domain-containing protein n=1 Tax=Mucilaginibacter sp. TaxID=1882438 RepID=UPI003D0C0EC8
MKKYHLLLIALVAVAYCSCKKTESIVPHDRLQKLLLKDTLQLYVGEVKNVPITISPSNYHLDSLKYISSDPSVITISDSGVMKALKIGTSQISITNISKSITVSTNVTVVPAPIDSLKLALIAYYPFTKSSASDSSGLGNNGTVYGAKSVPDRFGNANAAFQFDGMSSYISVKDNLYLRLYETDFTQNAWVKLSDYNPSYGSVILGKRIPGIADAGYTFSIGGYINTPGMLTEGTLHFGPGGGSINNAFGTKIVTLNQWHMVTNIYSYTNQTLTIYVDGILDNITTNIAAPNASIGANVYIGRDDPNNTDNGYFIQGLLDDIRIYNRAISASEVKKLYNLTH